MSIVKAFEENKKKTPILPSLHHNCYSYFDEFPYSIYSIFPTKYYAINTFLCLHRKVYLCHHLRVAYNFLCVLLILWRFWSFRYYSQENIQRAKIGGRRKENVLVKEGGTKTCLEQDGGQASHSAAIWSNENWENSEEGSWRLTIRKWLSRFGDEVVINGHQKTAEVGIRNK